jgi:hypothetical protein
MTTLLINTKVRDYASWRPAYEHTSQVGSAPRSPTVASTVVQKIGTTWYCGSMSQMWPRRVLGPSGTT